MTYGELHKYLKAYNKKAAAEGRPFEDLFSEYQSEMIRQSIAYAENRAEKIYVYSDFECGAIMARPAFIIEGKFYPDYEWDKAIREGKESSSISREEKRDIRRTILCYAVAVLIDTDAGDAVFLAEIPQEGSADGDQAHLRRKDPPSESAVRL